ncbi:hypothetical protein B0O99DRAFT_635691 [Bisporella sp. PMI_857]|nr:hypothetical protein B0O99DRAFT_635691 [Bisporella sp. PMI_857]
MGRYTIQANRIPKTTSQKRPPSRGDPQSHRNDLNPQHQLDLQPSILISKPKDVTDFLFFCTTVMDEIHPHHGAEEKLLPPASEPCPFYSMRSMPFRERLCENGEERNADGGGEAAGYTGEKDIMEAQLRAASDF